MPVGAGAFEIDRPRAHGGTALNAADFGFSVTNDDNAAALARAFAEAKRVGASRLDLPPGTYRCFGDGVRVEGLRDFTFDGHGAVLVFRRSARQGGANLTVAGTERCVFRNFTMDWDWTRDPLASIGTCVNKFVDEKNDDASYFDMKLRGTVRQIPVGISYRLLHYYYGLGGITMHGNRHFTLEDVDIWSCRGHGLAVGGGDPVVPAHPLEREACAAVARVLLRHPRGELPLREPRRTPRQPHPRPERHLPQQRDGGRRAGPQPTGAHGRIPVPQLPGRDGGEQPVGAR